jgi:hypothetical protein
MGRTTLIHQILGHVCLVSFEYYNYIITRFLKCNRIWFGTASYNLLEMKWHLASRVYQTRVKITQCTDTHKSNYCFVTEFSLSRWLTWYTLFMDLHRAWCRKCHRHFEDTQCLHLQAWSEKGLWMLVNIYVPALTETAEDSHTLHT